MMQGDKPLSPVQLAAQIMVNAILRHEQIEENQTDSKNFKKNLENPQKSLDFVRKRSVTIAPNQ